MAREDDEERAERGGGASDSDGSAGDGPGSERSTYLVQGGVSAVEVPLVDLVKPRPRREFRDPTLSLSPARAML